VDDQISYICRSLIPSFFIEIHNISVHVLFYVQTAQLGDVLNDSGQPGLKQIMRLQTLDRDQSAFQHVGEALMIVWLGVVH
jgi:hypothetical protein